MISWSGRLLLITALCLIASKSTFTQPQLNFKRIVNNWPTIELYFSVGCDGQPTYTMKKSDMRVVENGIEIGEFELWCPDPTARCSISVSLAFDVSGSMTGPGLAGAKTAGNAFIDQMDGISDEAAVIAFQSSAWVVQSMTTIKPLLKSAINGLNANGATALWDGIYTGLTELIANGVNTCRSVIVLTDGNNSSGNRTPADIISLANRNRIRVYTIGFGVPINSAELQAIANTTGGRYYETPDASQLTQIYLEISSLILQGFQECQIKYTAKCMDGGLRTVDLSLQNFCNGSDTKTKTYKAPKDTSTYVPLRIELGKRETRGNTNVKVPLTLVDEIQNDLFHPATFTILYDEACTQFVNIATPPGSLLEGVPITITPMPGGVTFQTTDRKIINGSGMLAELTFKASDPDTKDTTCCELKLLSWTFEAGCFRPVLKDGEICIIPRQPELLCSTTFSSFITWVDQLSKYLPEEIDIRIQVANAGDRSAYNVLYKLNVNPLYVELVNPNTPIIPSNPSTIQEGTYNEVSWRIRFKTRLPGDTLSYCGEVLSNNHKTISCCSVLRPVPPPSVSVHGSTQICVGDSLRLSATPGYKSYRWTTGDTTQSIYVRSAGNYSYSAIDFNDKSFQSNAVSISVRSRPLLTMSGSKIICKDSSITIAIQGSFQRITWSTGDTTQTLKIDKEGLYWATVHDAGSCTGRSDTLSITIAQNLNPTISGLRTACQNTSTSYSTLPLTGVLYQWVVSGGAIVSGNGSTSVTVLWGNGMVGQVALTLVQTASGCKSVVQTGVSLTGAPKPTITASNGTRICSGTSTILDAGSGYSSYLWSNGATSRGITVRYPGKYAVRVSQGTGCDGVSDTVVVTVDTLLVSPITGPTDVCRNTVTDYSVAQQAGYSYQWTVVGGTILSAATLPNIRVQWSSASSGKVRCKVTRGSCTDSVSADVAIGTSIKPAITVLGSTKLCEGDQVTLDAGSGYLVYQWSNGLRTRIINVDRAGYYSVYVETDGGCTGTSDPIQVTVHPLPPKPQINRTGDVLSTIIASGYQWFLDGVPLQGETNQFLIVKKSGNYTVTIMDANGCKATSLPFSVLTGIDSPKSLANDIALYPDPTTGRIQVHLPETQEYPVTLSIHSVLGKVVAEKKLTYEEGRTHAFDLDMHPDGVYLLIVTARSSVSSQTFMKLR